MPTQKTLHDNLSLVVLGLKDAFIALTPYFIISSIAILLIQGLNLLFPLQNFNELHFAAVSLQTIYPLLLLVSIAFHLAKIYDIDDIGAVILAFTLLLTVSSVTQPSHGLYLKFDHKFSIYALFVPIISTFVLKTVSIKNQQDKSFSIDSSYLLDYFSVFLNAFLASLAIILVATVGITQLFLVLPLPALTDLIHDPFTLIVIRQFFGQLLFFFGLHGVNVYDLFINNHYLALPLFENLTGKQFLDTFISAGSAFAIALCVFLQKKDEHSYKVAMFALPFLCFNIAEIILFCLPIVFNRCLLIPFLLTPVLDDIIAYVALVQWDFAFLPINVPWTMPTYITAYLVSGGQLSVFLLHIIILCVNVAICWPFVRYYLNTQSTAEHLTKLQYKLQLDIGLEHFNHRTFQKTRSTKVYSYKATSDILELLENNELCVYYQPKVSVSGEYCFNFEALLRLRMQDGQVLHPWFLPLLAEADLASVIDLWTCQQIKNDLTHLRQVGFHPHISVNLFPETFEDNITIKTIADTLKGMNIEFELIEKAFAHSQNNQDQLDMLKKQGFSLTIDKFGTGYSSLNSLYELQAETVKLHKSLMAMVHTQQGKQLYGRIARMCKELGYVLVAEGVDTEAQYQVAVASNVDLIQGRYYSKPLLLEQLIPFTVSTNGSLHYATRKLFKANLGSRS